MNKQTKRIAVIAMFSALAFVLTVVGRFPVVLFLKYDPKDIIIAISGFILGPISVVITSVVVSFVEMVTISNDGVIGFIMNVIGTISFAGIAAIIYKQKRDFTGAVLGLLAGVLMLTVMMLLWNIIIIPFYLHVSRDAVIDLIMPALLPFNLIKGGLNMAITLLVYKPIVLTLRKVNILEASAEKKPMKSGIIIFAVIIMLTCIVATLVLQGII